MIRDSIVLLNKPDPCGLVDAAKSKDADSRSSESLVESLIFLIHDAQAAETSDSQSKTRYVGARRIIQRAMLANKGFQDSQSIMTGKKVDLKMAADTLAARFPKSSNALCSIRVGRLIAQVLNIEVGGMKIVSGGKHGHYRVEDQYGNPV
jgi:hypothetical protein